MNDFGFLKCICLKCHWVWEVLSIEPDRNQECPECKSFDTRSFLKDFDI
jgi:NAD-dependent SIR2 family protein deacetylase